MGGGGPRRLPWRWLLFLLAVPVAVAVNALRVAGMALLAAGNGPEAVTGTLHDAAGLVMFAVSMTMLWYLRRFLAWIELRVSSPRS